MTIPQAQPYVPLDLEALLKLKVNTEWVVENILPPDSTAILSGPSGSGKTWLILDLALSIATGEKWLGQFEVQQGNCLLVDEENNTYLLQNRMRQLLKYRGLSSMTDKLGVFFLVGESINLTPIGREHKPTVTFEKLLATTQALKPVLVIMDSLTRVHRSNESDSSQMSVILAITKRLVTETGSDVLFTHHFTKHGKPGSGERIRGSGDLRAWPDTTVLVEEQKGHIVITMDKTRHCKPLKPFKIKLDVVDDNTIGLAYAGKVKPEVWDWLHALLANGKTLSRTELITLAKMDGICAQRKLDDVLKYQTEKKKNLIKKSQGKDVLYRLPDAFEQAML
jgi:hypothetical protein